MSAFDLGRVRGRIAAAKMMVLAFYRNRRQLDAEELERIAASHVASQIKAERKALHRERRQAKRAQGQGPSLIDSVLNMIERLHGEAECLPSTGDIESSRSGVPPAAVRKARQPQPELNEGYPDGVFTGNVTGAVRIGDEEYHSSIHALDRSTHNWRLSLQRNAEIEAERRALWVERLAALKAEGKLQ
jgi:hypothetical protein